MLLDRWRQNKKAQAEWMHFIHSQSFKDGMDVLAAHGVPVFYPGEKSHTIAQRHAWMAGFHFALELVSRVPDIHHKRNQDSVPEWDHVVPEQDLTDE